MVNKIELIFLEEKIVKNCKYIFAILLLPLDYECWPSFELLVTWISLLKNTLFKFWIFFFAQHFWRKDYFKKILICRRHIDQNDARHTINTQVDINSYHTYIIRYLICRPIDFDICFSINYSKHAETPKLYRYPAWIKYVDVTHRLSAWITLHLSNDIFLSFIQAIIVQHMKRRCQQRITDISGPRQFGTATIRHPRRRFGSWVPTVRDLVTDSSGVGLKWNIKILNHQGISYLCV